MSSLDAPGRCLADRGPGRTVLLVGVERTPTVVARDIAAANAVVIDQFIERIDVLDVSEVNLLLDRAGWTIVGANLVSRSE